MDFGTDYNKFKTRPTERHELRRRSSYEEEPNQTPFSWKEKFGNDSQNICGIQDLGLDFRPKDSASRDVSPRNVKTSGTNSSTMLRTSREVATWQAIESFGSTLSSTQLSSSRHGSVSSSSNISTFSSMPLRTSGRHGSTSSESDGVAPVSGSPSVRDRAKMFQKDNPAHTTNTNCFGVEYDLKSPGLSPTSPPGFRPVKPPVSPKDKLASIPKLNPPVRAPSGAISSPGRPARSIIADQDSAIGKFMTSSKMEKVNSSPGKLSGSLINAVTAKPWESCNAKGQGAKSVINISGGTKTHIPERNSRFRDDVYNVLETLPATVKCQTLPAKTESNLGDVTFELNVDSTLKLDSSKPGPETNVTVARQRDKLTSLKPKLLTAPNTSPKPVKKPKTQNLAKGKSEVHSKYGVSLESNVDKSPQNYDSSNSLSNPAADEVIQTNATGITRSREGSVAKETVTQSAIVWTVIPPGEELTPSDHTQNSETSPPKTDATLRVRPVPAPRKMPSEGNTLDGVGALQRRESPRAGTLGTNVALGDRRSQRSGQPSSITSDDVYDDVLLMIHDDDDGSKSDGASESSRSSAIYSQTSSIAYDYVYDDVLLDGEHSPPNLSVSLGRDSFLKSHLSKVTRRQNSDKYRFLSNPECSRRSSSLLEEPIYECVDDIKIRASEDDDPEESYEEIDQQQSQDESRFRSQSGSGSDKSTKGPHLTVDNRRRRDTTQRQSNTEDISPPVPKRKQSLPDVLDAEWCSSPPPVPPRFELGGTLEKDLPPTPPDTTFSGPTLPPRTYKNKGATLPNRRSPGSRSAGAIHVRNAFPQNPERSVTLPRGLETPTENYIDPVKDLDSVPTPGKLCIRVQSSNSFDQPKYLHLTDGEIGETSTDAFQRTSSNVTSVFETQELYQVYHCGTVAIEVLTKQGIQPFPDTTDDDAVSIATQDSGCQQDIYGTFEDLKLRPDRERTRDQINTTLYSVIKSSAGYRTLWCEMPEVVSSGCLKGMSNKDKRLQETLFEIITSEASYHKSMKVLIESFYNDEKLTSILSKRDRKDLFSNIIAVRETSRKFLNELEAKWSDNFWLTCDLCDLVKDFALNKFEAYVNYLTAQHLQDRKLKELTNTEPAFKEALKKIELCDDCRSLPLQSFLALPFQRMTRIPLLMKSVMDQLDQEHEYRDYQRAAEAYEAGKQLTEKCNERVKLWQNIEEISIIESSLIFKSVKTIAITSKSRSLVKRGELTKLNVQLSGLFQKKKESVYLFVFNDLVLITKRRSKEDKYEVLDHAEKKNVSAEIVDSQKASDMLSCTVPNINQLLLLVLTEPHRQSISQYVLTAQSESDLTRWNESLMYQKQTEDEDEHLYDVFDCPTMQVLHSYVAQEPDEMDLQESDVIEVYRKMNDGWYEGLNARSDQRGWFPSNYCMSISLSNTPGTIVTQKYEILSKARRRRLPSVTSV